VADKRVAAALMTGNLGRSRTVVVRMAGGDVKKVARRGILDRLHSRQGGEVERLENILSRHLSLDPEREERRRRLLGERFLSSEWVRQLREGSLGEVVGIENEPEHLGRGRKIRLESKLRQGPHLYQSLSHFANGT
jgi:hypothetical protein